MIQKLFLTCLDAVFPPREDTLVARQLTEEAVRALYAPTTVHGVTALSSFSDHRIRALIHEAKFHQSERAWKLLNVLLREYLTRTQTDSCVIVPIPLSRARLRARGYNQVLQIARAGPLGAKIRIIDTVLIRTRDTRPQTELPREARLTNIHHAFSVFHPDTIRDKHLIVVDDVTTTGATLGEAKATLLPHVPASVTLLALAH